MFYRARLFKTLCTDNTRFDWFYFKFRGALIMKSNKFLNLNGSCIAGAVVDAK